MIDFLKIPTSTADKKKPLRVAVDTKNLALYAGGIAAFFRPLLHAWITQRPHLEFVLVGPPFEMLEFSELPNCTSWPIPWPDFLPRPLRHPFYDNIQFPRAIRAVQPDVLFTPYHDVRLPRGIPSVMMVHDTCLHDLPDVYPFRIRAYYLHMLKRNLKVASRVLTVSQTSRRDLFKRYGVSDALSGVVPNAMDPKFAESSVIAEATLLRAERGPGVHLFYPGGSDHRKNIRRLSRALAELIDNGQEPHLWITGSCDAAWTACLNDMPESEVASFHFLGRLSAESLAAQYRACDAVVYPTLCEGFGRVALEAMELGVPLACSDIEVLREVAGDYPTYFNPREPSAIAAAISAAVTRGAQPSRRCEDFQPAHVAQTFISQMDLALGRTSAAL
jgi:glycosyltransferase involved in cell wall biosynthesis